MRPDVIGSPFKISEPGYVTDAEHQDHLQHRLTTPAPRARPCRPRRRRRRRVPVRCGAPVAPRRAGRPAAAPRWPPRRAAGRAAADAGARLADVPGGRREGVGGGRGAEGDRLADVPQGGRAAEGERGRRAGRSRWPRPPRCAGAPALVDLSAAPGRLSRATTRRASRSRPGWPGRPRSAGCRPSCR